MAQAAVYRDNSAVPVALTGPLSIGGPHTQQYVEYYGQQPQHATLHRVLDNADPVLKYDSRTGLAKTTLGWGQRKLSITLIEFLTLYSKPGDLVVYAGAAPGTGLVYAISLFPELEFHLYDPRRFAQQLTTLANVKLYSDDRNGWFTDDTAQRYGAIQNPPPGQKARRVLLVSDIRNRIDREQFVDAEKKVLADMLAQQRWFQIMGLGAGQAQLKFRLPYSTPEYEFPTKVKYLDGTLFPQPWAPVTSTETRLVPNGTMIEWDSIKYEDKLYQHNVFNRACYYDQPVVSPGFDHCYDCASEVAILRQHLLKKTGQVPTDADIAKMIAALDKTLANGRFNVGTWVRPKFDNDDE